MDNFNVYKSVKKVQAKGDTKMCKENLENNLSADAEIQKGSKGISTPKFCYYGMRKNPKITGTKILKAEFGFLMEKVSRCKVNELKSNTLMRDKITQRHINIVYKDLKKYGHLYPILLSKENEIIVGNDIYEIARAVDLKYLPVVYESDLTLKEKCSYYFITFSLAPIADAGVFPRFAYEELWPYYLDLVKQLGYDITPYKQ